MKKKFVTFLICAMMATSGLASAVNVQAAPVSEAKTYRTVYEMFDAEHYAEENPDVVAVLGTSKRALYKHFIYFGRTEGRSINDNFDVNAYKSAYSDLVEAFGDDIGAYYTHYIQFGQQEGRHLTTIDACMKEGITVTDFEGNVIAQPATAHVSGNYVVHHSSSANTNTNAPTVAPNNASPSTLPNDVWDDNVDNITSGVPETPDISETPEVPETPDILETPEVPETPEETCEHEWLPLTFDGMILGDCQTPFEGQFYCTICGEEGWKELLFPYAHMYVSNGVDSNHECSVCHATEEHDFSTIITISPDAHGKPYVVYICTGCPESYAVYSDDVTHLDNDGDGECDVCHRPADE